MKLSEALHELRVNLLRDNAVLALGSTDDRLWSDDTLVRYTDDAQRRWARLTLTLRDNSTPEIAQVRLRTGITQYSLHKSVRAVVSARYDTQNFDLWRVGHALLGNTVVDTERPFGLDDTSTTGAPTAYSTDESLDFEDDHAIILRVFSMPTVAENGKVIYLRTARSPLYPLDYDKIETQVLEIPDEFCLDMLEWAAYRAMRTSDLDGHATQAEAHKLRFEEAVAEQLKTNRTKRRQPMFFAPGIAGMP